MMTNSGVTLWHFDKKSGGFTRIFFEKAYIFGVRKISENRLKQRGFYNEDCCSIRIPTEEDLDIRTGDYVCGGKCGDEVPDRKSAFKILEISDNRRGTSPHWRLSCGG